MYKKLEDDKKVVLAAEETPEVECTCACGRESQSSEEPTPEANTALVLARVHFEKNG